VLYSTDDGPHYNTWPDAGTTPFRSTRRAKTPGSFNLGEIEASLEDAAGH
jgi:arylsulfatase